MLNTWSFPGILDAVLDAAEPTSVFPMAQVCQRWRHAVQSRLYHLKVTDDAPRCPFAFICYPRSSPSFGLTWRRGTRTVDRTALLLCHCRILDVDNHFLRALLSHDVPQSQRVLAHVDTMRLTSRGWDSVLLAPDIPRLVMLNGMLPEDSAMPLVRATKVVLLQSTRWEEIMNHSFSWNAVEALVIIFQPTGVAPAQPPTGADSADGLPEELRSLVKILSPAQFSKTRITIVNAESLYLPKRDHEQKRTVREVLEHERLNSSDFATRLRLTKASFRFLTLDEYRAEIGEREFAIETDSRAYLRLPSR